MASHISGLPADVLRLFEGVSSASASGDPRAMGFNISTIYARGIHPVVPVARLVGRAITLRYVPACDDFARRERETLSRTRNELVETLEPGAVIVADDDGVCVVPRDLAEELARVCVEHEEREVYLRQRLEAGESIVGVYPPSEEVLRQFRERRR